MKSGRSVRRKTDENYRAVFFDLYGTLIDVHADEKMPRLWRCMSGWYADRGAVYTPGELRAAYLAAVRRDLVRVTGEWEKLGIAQDFDRIYISSDCGAKKPEAVFYRKALEDTGLKAQECLMVGNDHTCDVLGARRAGMDSFYILSGLSPKESRGTYEKDRRDAAFSLRGMDLEKAGRMILSERMNV